MARVLKQKKRVYSQSFKETAVARMQGCDSVVGLAKELGICWNLLYRWRDRQRKAAQLGQEKVEQQRAKAMREEIATLKSALGEKVLEVNFFKGALQKVEAQRQRLMRHGGAASTTRSGK